MLETKGDLNPKSLEGRAPVPFACSAGCVFFDNNLCRTQQGPRVKYSRKQAIFSEGDPAAHCFKVVEGAVRLSRVLADGHRQVLDIIMPGDTFGLEIANEYSATAEAVGDTVVLKCPRACIDRRSDGDHGRDMLEMLSRSLGAAQDHVALLGHQGARERVASFLLKLAKAQGRKKSERIDVLVGRQDIADYLGLTLETTCRVLSEFKAHRIISAPSRHEIVIHNFSRMEAIAEGEV